MYGKSQTTKESERWKQEGKEYGNDFLAPTPCSLAFLGTDSGPETERWKRQKLDGNKGIDVDLRR